MPCLYRGSLSHASLAISPDMSSLSSLSSPTTYYIGHFFSCFTISPCKYRHDNDIPSNYEVFQHSGNLADEAIRFLHVLVLQGPFYHLIINVIHYLMHMRQVLHATGECNVSCWSGWQNCRGRFVG